MRYAVISDLHSNLEALNAVLEQIEDTGVDRVICLGDVVGYNANPNECVRIVRERGIPTICGNHDAVACGLEEPWGFNPVALKAAMWTREALDDDSLEWLRSLPDAKRFGSFVAAHGSPADRNTYLFSWEDILPHVGLVENLGCSLCFFGHTHSPGVFSTDGAYSLEEDGSFSLEEGKCFFINPGSVGQPRDGDTRAAFGLFDDEKREFRLVRVPYPVMRTAERIEENGLPRFLAERLFLGR